MNDSRILVTGATGQQGGSVVDALLRKRQNVTGLTRNPESEKARILAERGVTLVTGDMNDKESLIRAFSGIDTLFLVITPFEKGVENETAQGIIAIDAAKEAGVNYIVYSSVSDADRDTGIPHFDSKFLVEEYLKKSGIAYSIIAPVFFYDNFISPWTLPGLQDGSLAQGLPATTYLQAISVKNIGEFCALALMDRERFQGKRIDIAGDSLSGAGYAEGIAKASAKPIGYFEVPIDMVRQNSEDLALMYEWFHRVGYTAGIDELKNDYPEVEWESFSDWAGRQDWGMLEKE
jgi:uncharacterized protein YbjT (DUF2867 family)